MYVCMYVIVCMYVCMYVCIYIYMYMYVCIMHTSLDEVIFHFIIFYIDCIKTGLQESIQDVIVSFLPGDFLFLHRVAPTFTIDSRFFFSIQTRQTPWI